MKTIKDGVHDYIEVEGVARELLDTPPVQRLRHISQLGTATLVYPAANHTRFEHSLGVYHLASEALSHLGIGGEQAKRVEAAALLHDIGHCPYSHNTEEVVYRRTGKYHDEIHDLIGSGVVADILTDHGINPDTVADLVAGDGELGQLVSGELDVDRMDYLVRDAHHTGVPYGTIDTERLIRELRLVDDTLVLAEGNVQSAESLLLARALMNPTVYNHHVGRISRAMLQRMTDRLLRETDTSAKELRRFDDHDLWGALRGADATADQAQRLANRDLYKRAVWAEMDEVPEALLDADHEEIHDLEREIAGEVEVGAAHVVLDVPDRPSMAESSSRVVVNGEVRPLAEASTLVSALQAAQKDQWRLGVYAPPDATDRVGEAAVRVLGLDVDGARVSDRRPGIHARLDDFGED